MINDFRIDSKLIHGQVTTRLLVFKRCNRILIIDDDVAQDAALRNIMNRVLPNNVKVHFRTMTDAVDTLGQIQESSNRYLVILRNPRAALQLLEHGYKFDTSLTCGQLTDDQGNGISVLPGVNLLPEDIAALHELADSGVTIVFDPKATEAAIPWSKVQKNLTSASKADSQGSSFAGLTRVFNILDLFLESPANSLTVNEIQASSQLPFSTTYRLVSFLEKGGYLEKDPATKKEHLGWKFLKLQTESIELRLHRFYTENIFAALHDLRDCIGETTAAFTLDGQTIRCIGHAESGHPICARFSDEQTIPFQLDAVGRVFVASMPEKEWTRYETPGVVSAQDFQAYREKGYCLYYDTANGSTSVTVPVLARDKALCVLITQGPSFRFHSTLVTRATEQMRQIAQQLSKEAAALS